MAITLSRTCDTDGCEETMTLTGRGGAWVVQHGLNPEHVLITDSNRLFVTEGYRAWAITVHEHQRVLD